MCDVCESFGPPSCISFCHVHLQLPQTDTHTRPPKEHQLCIWRSLNSLVGSTHSSPTVTGSIVFASTPCGTDLALSLVLKRALAYLRHGDDDNDYELSHDSGELYRQCVSYLLDELLVRVPVRYTGLLRESYVGNPNILSLARASSCTGITSLQCDLDCITQEEIDNLGPFIRRTPSLSKVGVHAVSSKVELDFTFETDWRRWSRACGAWRR